MHLQTTPYVENYVAQILHGRARLERELKNLGIFHWPSHANFLLLRIGPQHREFVSAMRERGILVRDRSSDPGCDGCVRITIGTSAQMDRLLAALREIAAALRLGNEVTA